MKSMKSTGIVRKLDNAGRFVMPISLRRTLGLNDGEGAMEVFVDGDSVILRKYNPSCTFCNNMDDLVEYNGARVCRECVQKLVSLSGKA